jgi:hypothetical protein
MAIEPLANHALKKFKIKSKNWGIYGHGAGAHFVHRLVLHHPETSHTLAIAANLGWYLSMSDQEWPFGLSNSNIDNAKLKKSFSKYFLLMLGRADTSTKPNTPYVADHWDIINLQGEHRLARGRNFFKSAVAKSKEVNQFFKWGMVEVPTTKGHSNTEQWFPMLLKCLCEIEIMQAYKKRGFLDRFSSFFFVLLTPNPESLSPIGWAVAAVTLLMAIWWATEAVPVAVTALLP